MAGSAPQETPPEFPPELEDALLSLFEAGVGSYEADLEAICERFPEHAALVRERARHGKEICADFGTKAPSRAVVKRGSIGPYRIIGLLGEGGMGTVYLAEQREPIRRRVAVKVVKLGMDSKRVLDRFEVERQALAVMNHEHIAKVYEAGTTERGQPYFVMEFVEGVPLHEYCDNHRLSLEDRIELFQGVCAGVQHAHQKGVVHRDLKPGNVLVSRREDWAIPKIIDFGLARATGMELVDRTIFTEFGQLMGTPEYMSPEQAMSDPSDIDTRSDVYSLGVMLYELLSGELPFTEDRLRQAGLGEIQRIIREEEPVKPSARVSVLGADAATEFARKRRTSVANLRRALRGDLDWIVMKAMAKEPERRYESATSLARELRRYLEHEAVEAGPPSAGYRLGKMARKYRVQMVAAVLVFVVLIAGIITSWCFYARSEADRKRAIDQERIAQAERREARRQAGIAEAENARLSGLAAVVQLEAAAVELKDLQPAWPGRITAMRTWLRDRGDRLERALPAVRNTLRELETKALPQTRTEKNASRVGHPKYQLFRARQTQVEALRRAMAVRQRVATAAEVPLPAETPEDPDATNDLAWSKVDPDRPVQAYGDEALGLAQARRAMVLAQAQQSDGLHEIRDTLAWALLANGCDEEARAASKAALDTAPPADRAEFKVRFARLLQAIADAPRKLVDSEAELDRLDTELDQRQTWSFADEADRFLYTTLRQVERDLVAFLGAEGPRLDVQRRLAWAERIQRLSEVPRKGHPTWDAARHALRKADGKTASKLYGARYHAQRPIDLRPQWGLVPIGMNPRTLLWEFYHLRSAFDPRKGDDPAAIEIPTHHPDGRIDVGEGTGIVFVLIPGGTFIMGAQKTNPEGANYDAQAQSDEAPHDVTLDCYFLARHELTQGQWRRLSLQENPSRYSSGVSVLPRVVTLAHPVEMVDWNMCRDLFQRHGLSLPREDQWEYGCRGGTDTPWHPGGEVAGLKGYANILDRLTKRRAPNWTGTPAPFDDEHMFHAPVGTFAPNRFGLHDVHGSVWEWCQDLYGSSRSRVNRGGSFNSPAYRARSAYRNSDDPTTRRDCLGVRPTRALDR